MKKLLWTALLLILILMGMLGITSAQAESSGSCGDNVTWTLDDEGTLTISGSGRMLNYSYNSHAPWYSSKLSIKAVIVEDGVTSIGDHSFSDCYQIENITIPDSVVSIGQWAFSYCSSLKDITIPKSVMTIARATFYGCSGLASITIPGNVTNIGSVAFDFCSGLTNVTISDGVTSIGSQAFEFCSGLTNITIPDSVTNIDSSAFEHCDGLTSYHVSGGNQYYSTIEGVLFNKSGTELILYPEGRNGPYSIPTSVTSIGSYAFFSCDGLTELIIPEGVKNIGNDAFLFNSGLKNISIPNSVISIGNSAFSGCDGLSSIIIPNRVTSVGIYAFSGCDNLTDVLVLTRNATFGGNVFANEKEGFSLTVLPDSTAQAYAEKNSIPYTIYHSPTESDFIYAVNNDDSVTILGYNGTGTSAEIPAAIDSIPVKHIGAYAFSGCTDLMSITIPSNVSSIGDKAFDKCSARKYTAWDGNTAKLLSSKGYSFWCNEYPGIELKYMSSELFVIDADSDIVSVVIPDGVNTIRYRAFDGCTNLISIIIPSSVTSIGSDAFYNCTSLMEVAIPDSISQVSFAFNNCDAKLYATYGGNAARVLSKAGYSFWCDDYPDFALQYAYTNDEITGLRITAVNPASTSVLIPASVIEITNNAFSSCSSLTAISVEPDSVYFNAEDSVLYTKTMDTLICYPAGKAGVSFTVPDGLTCIGNYAFSGCSSLTNLTIPASVTALNDDVFVGCSSLQHIVFEGDVPALTKNSFAGCDQVESISFACGTFHPAQSTLYGVCGNSAVYSIENGTMTVMGKGTMWGYDTICFDGIYYDHGKPDTPWFDTFISRVIINEGITGIGAHAFSFKYSIASVSLPNSLQYIGGDAFCECSSLTAITIPSHVNQIQYCAFAECRSLSSITFEGSAPATIAYEPFERVTANVYYVPDASWKGKIGIWGGTLTWIKPNGGCGEDAGWVLDNIDTLRLSGSGTVSEATWTEYADGITTLSLAPGLGGIGGGLLSSLPNCAKVMFEGDLPASLASDAFTGLTATVYYPHSSLSWTADARQSYGGAVAWQPYCADAQGSIAAYEPILKEETQPADCVTNGWAAHWECSVCGKAFVDEALTSPMTEEALLIPAAGHTPVVVPGFPATCTELGLSDEIFCEVCGETIQAQEELPMLPHTDSVTLEALEPTCTAPGHTAEHRCAVCGALLEASVTVEKLPHTDAVSLAALEPTCAEAGRTEEHRCAICGEILTASTEIAPLGHNWGEPIYVWTDGNTAVTAARVCANDAAHIETETVGAKRVVTVSPTNDQAGQTEWISNAFENGAFELQRRPGGELPALDTLDTLALPRQLSAIEEEAFAGLACEAVIILDTCVSIGSKAFADCKKLVYVYIPSGVQSIAEDAFEGCPALCVDQK